MDLPENENDLAVSLKDWLEYNLVQFLSRLDLPKNESWAMPVIEDYVLVVAAKDYKDGGVGVFSLSAPSSSPYRIQGLLATALNNGC